MTRKQETLSKFVVNNARGSICADWSNSLSNADPIDGKPITAHSHNENNMKSSYGFVGECLSLDFTVGIFV